MDFGLAIALPAGSFQTAYYLAGAYQVGDEVGHGRHDLLGFCSTLPEKTASGAGLLLETSCPATCQRLLRDRQSVLRSKVGSDRSRGSRLS